MRFRIDWMNLSAVEPSLDDVRVHAEELARGYNEPRNAILMGHDEPLTADEVVEHYAEMIDDGARAFLLFRDGTLEGDGDLRPLRREADAVGRARRRVHGAAEFAFMIGTPAAQGKGLGTRYATMIHALGFGEIGLQHVYASVVPQNTASLRVFEKIGYWRDDSSLAREFADDPLDIVLAIDRPTFERVNAEALSAITVRAI
jgi:RimJ/RimL family protein N-acetyltransferase